MVPFFNLGVSWKLCKQLSDWSFIIKIWLHVKFTGGDQANTTAKSNQNQTGNVTPPVLGDVGGAGLPGINQMFTGIADASLANHLMQNPAISEIMQSLLSNPEYMKQIVNLNPQLLSMTELNPQMREMLQNPEVLRQLTSRK
ncbi:hypothetical protein SAY86_000412 [Trapa natans]|uniref:STI1 domain-containing protein n=1 Tax=Trapa natans TaxID=22666 RepID=A0AAN7MAW6_TRANT|nr:hypothetical protein SAY86_000412 [Trapa natans]